MQLHGPTEVVKEIAVTDYGTEGNKALRFPGDISLVLQTPADCDELIKAAAKAKRQLLGEPPAWCPATTDLDGETLYCDRDDLGPDGTHPGSHHAPGTDPGSEIAWSDCGADWGSATASQQCTLGAGHGGPHRDSAGHEWDAEDDDEAREAAEFLADAASLDELEPLVAQAGTPVIVTDDADFDHISVGDIAAASPLSVDCPDCGAPADARCFTAFGCRARFDAAQAAS